MSYISTFLFLFLIFSVNSQVKDIDGNTYKTIVIGSQTWTAKNLNVSKYRNGDVIPQVQNPEQWASLTTGAWCYYENKTANGTTYGKLYNWYAVNDSRGLAPLGYHIPSKDEWTILYRFLGNQAGTKLKSSQGWKGTDLAGNGVNTVGFNGLPSGQRDVVGRFITLGTNGYWWSTSIGFNQLYRLGFDFNCYGGELCGHDASDVDGLSVRCVKD